MRAKGLFRLFRNMVRIDFKLIFIYFERDSKQGRTERKGDRIPSRLHTISAEPTVRLKLTNSEIMIRAEIKSRMFNWLSHQGAPNFILNVGMRTAIPVKHLTYQRHIIITLVMVSLSDQPDVPSVSAGVPEQNQWLLISPVSLGDLGSVICIVLTGSMGASYFPRRWNFPEAQSHWFSTLIQALERARMAIRTGHPQEASNSIWTF